MNEVGMHTVSYGGGRIDSFHRTVQALADDVEARDPSLRRHSANVARYAVAIARDMGLSPLCFEEIHIASLLHDIGNIGISERIIRTPARLSREDFEAMKAHPGIGIRILDPLGFPPAILSAVHQHHERYDGTGYPRGLAGEAISLFARILSTADAIDVMLSGLPYCWALSAPEVIQVLKRESGRQFDPLASGSAQRLLGGRALPAHVPPVGDEACAFISCAMEIPDSACMRWVL